MHSSIPLNNYRICMRRVAFLFRTLVLCACSSVIVSPQPRPPSPTATAVPAVDTPRIDPTSAPQDCGYQWANQDLPKLSGEFQQAVQALQPQAQASAYAFGENCIRSDGSIASFAAMETDFNVTLLVDDLANESVLGRWIVQVM